MPSGTYESLKDFFFASYVTFYLLLVILHIIEKILFSMLEEVKLPIRLLGEDRKIKKPAKKKCTKNGRIDGRTKILAEKEMSKE